MPTIRVRPETYERMKKWAIPLEDTPNDAIERILNAAEEHRACMTEASSRNGETTGTQDEKHKDAAPSPRE